MRIFVKIQYADGSIKVLDTANFTIADMEEMYSAGGVIVEYINE